MLNEIDSELYQSICKKYDNQISIEQKNKIRNDKWNKIQKIALHSNNNNNNIVSNNNNINEKNGNITSVTTVMDTVNTSNKTL